MTAIEFIELPPVEWEAAIAKLEGFERRELENRMTDLAQRVVLAHGYLDAQHNQIDHDLGVRWGNGRVTKFRKSAGFAYPKQDLSF